MEFSCYYIYAENFIKYYIFIRNKNDIQIIINYIYETDEEYEEYNFVINIDELQKITMLYFCYIMSIYLTKNIYVLEYIKNTGYTIMCRKNCKNKYYTNKYEYSYYIFTNKPTELKIHSNNNEKVIKCIKDYNKLHDIGYFHIFLRYTEKLIASEINKIEAELEKEERRYDEAKLYKSYLKKIIPENYNDDILNIIYGKILDML